MLATRERKSRNHLTKLGFRLHKAPARHWTRAEHGVGYQIALADNPNAFICGDGDREYGMTLKEVEDFIAFQAAAKVAEDLKALLGAYASFGGDRFVEVAATMVREAA